MKKTLLPVALVVLCGVAGCLPTSINPLYTDKDLVFSDRTGVFYETRLK